jgi:uncharacterized protein
MTTPPGIKALCAAVLLLASALPAGATDVPYLSGRVNDEAGLLSMETVQHLNGLLKAHEDSTSNQVAVLTVPSLGGEEIEEFSIKVVEAWKLGQRGKDNGVLLLVSRDDRRVRIEVGRGLEGVLPDITCGSIIRNDILPKFKAGDYDAGVTGGVESILAAISGSYVADATSDSGSSVEDVWALIVASLIFFLVIGVFTTILILLPSGAQTWFLYLFLIPFWATFPMALYGMTAGLALLGSYLVGVPILRKILHSTEKGRRLAKSFASGGSSGGFFTSSGGGWSSSSGSSSSFSGGGGSFSGGGASGSW